MQICEDGACKCGANSDCKAVDLVDTCTAGVCSCQGNTCNTDVSDGCTAGMGCTCGGSAQCTGNLKCVSGACACAEDSDCSGLTDTCVKAAMATTGECKCGSADCDATKSSVCDGGTCKCGATAECGGDPTLPKCLEPMTAATPTAGSTTATCQVFDFNIVITSVILYYFGNSTYSI